MLPASLPEIQHLVYRPESELKKHQRAIIPYIVSSSRCEPWCRRHMCYYCDLLLVIPNVTSPQSFLCRWVARTLFFQQPAEKCEAAFQLLLISALTFWPRNYFFNFSTPVYKMCIIQEQNTLELQNKLHFKKRRVYAMFKLFSTYICWINI